MPLKSISILLAILILIAASPAGAGEGAQKIKSGKETTRSEKKPGTDCPACPGSDSGTGEPPNAFCPFKYLTYFLFLAFAVTLGSVIVLMDVATGFSMELSVDYIRWVKNGIDSIDGFFNIFGCAGY